MRSRCRRHRGFSLIELMVVIGIIAVLIGLLLPAIIRSRESARTIQCASQLRQLGQALANYANQFDGHLPAWSGWHVAGGDGTGEDEPGPGWTEQLAPFFVPPTSPVYNCPSFVDGYPINYGTSWIMVVDLERTGPTADVLMTYGPDDQMSMFGRGELRPALFDDAAIAADPNLITLEVISEPVTP